MRSDQHNFCGADDDAPVCTVADQAAYLPVDRGHEETVVQMRAHVFSLSNDPLKGLLVQPHDAADVFFKFVHGNISKGFAVQRIVPALHFIWIKPGLRLGGRAKSKSDRAKRPLVQPSRFGATGGSDSCGGGRRLEAWASNAMLAHRAAAVLPEP